MTALDDAATFAADPALIPPLTAALVQAAVSIGNEDPTTHGHLRRANLAYTILNTPTGPVGQAFAWAMSTNSTVVSEWTAGNYASAQGDFAFVIASVWDAIAGTSLDG